MNRRTKMWVAAVCLLALFAQTAFAFRRLSLTYDEPIYTAIGYADLTTGDVRSHGVIGHPPLVNLLTAWPLLLDSARPDARQVSSWGTEDSLGFSRALMGQLGPLERVALVTRVPVMWLTLLLAAFVHLRGADGNLLAQVDRQPLDGRFPTSYWLPGQIVTDVISSSPTPHSDGNSGGSFVLVLGMYTWPPLERLPVVDASGTPQRDDTIVIDVPPLLLTEEVTTP